MMRGMTRLVLHVGLHKRWIELSWRSHGRM